MRALSNELDTFMIQIIEKRFTRHIMIPIEDRLAAFIMWTACEMLPDLLLPVHSIRSESNTDHISLWLDVVRWISVGCASPYLKG
jgi:hypothetical protein